MFQLSGYVYVSKVLCLEKHVGEMARPVTIIEIQASLSPF